MAIVVSTAALVYTVGVVFDIKAATIIDTLKKIPRLSANFLNDIGGNSSGSGIWGKGVNLIDFIFGAAIVKTGTAIVKIIDDKIIISDINSIINKKKVEITNDKITIISKKNLEEINDNIEINNSGDNIVNEKNQENININNEEEEEEEEEDINNRQKIIAPIKKTIEENIKKIFRGRPLVILGRGEKINNNNNIVWCDFDTLPEAIKKKFNVNKGVINRLTKDNVFHIIMSILKKNIVNKKITTGNIVIRDNALLKIIDDCFKNNELETTLEYFNNNTIKKKELLEMMEKDDLIDKNQCKQCHPKIYSKIHDTISKLIEEFLHFKFDSDTKELMIARNSLSNNFDYILSSKFDNWKNEKFLPFSILQDAITMMIFPDLFTSYSFEKAHKIVVDYLNSLFLKYLNNKNTIEKKELLEMMKKDDLIDKNKYKQDYHDGDIRKICDKINNIISSELGGVHFKFDSDTKELMIARNSLSNNLNYILSSKEYEKNLARILSSEEYEKWKNEKFLPFSVLQELIIIMILDYPSFFNELRGDYNCHKLKKIVVDYLNSLFLKCLNNNEQKRSKMDDKKINDLGGGKDTNLSLTAQSLAENSVKAVATDVIANSINNINIDNSINSQNLLPQSMMSINNINIDNSINPKENNEVGTNSNKDAGLEKEKNDEKHEEKNQDKVNQKGINNKEEKEDITDAKNNKKVKKEEKGKNNEDINNIVNEEDPLRKRKSTDNEEKNTNKKNNIDASEKKDKEEKNNCIVF